MDIILHHATDPGLSTGICTIFKSINIRARLTYTISGSNMNDLWERNLSHWASVSSPIKWKLQNKTNKVVMRNQTI